MSIEEDQLYNKLSNDCIVQQHDDDDDHGGTNFYPFVSFRHVFDDG